MTDPALARARADLPATLDRLKAYVRIPSVSTDPAYAEGIAAAQAFLRDWLTQLGFVGVRTLPSAGHAPVYGERLATPGAPTILVYGHYDVQPPDPLARWTSPPFEPTVRDGRLYGRGASDDKGPVTIALAAIEALLRTDGRLPVNVKVLIEGEEEIGSAHLAAVAAAHRDLLAADVVISADGARWRADLPTITIGARGLVGLNVDVRTAAKDLHSGRYGGAVANALHVVADLVASLHAPDGRVAVAGFYDGVDPPTAAERADLAAMPFDEAAFLAEFGGSAAGEPGFTLLERLLLRPTLEVNGLVGGYGGPGSKTVVPHEAHAKLTARLVPRQDPARVLDAVVAHLRARCPPGVDIAFDDSHGGTAAYLVPPDHPVLRVAAEVVGAVAGRPARRVRMGATLPINQIFAETLGLDTIPFSFATSDEDYHAPNEFFRLSALEEGLDAWIRLLRALGKMTAADVRVR